MFIAYEIDWDVDIEEALEKLDDMTYENAAEVLGISPDLYANMNTSERHDYAYSIFHHCPGAMDDLFDLPSKVVIPDEFEIKSVRDDMSDVTDWLSDKYGFCINGYKVKEA